MALLKEAFNKRWPLLARRFEALSYKQAAGQEYSNFLGNLIEKAKEADLDEMSSDETMALPNLPSGWITSTPSANRSRDANHIISVIRLKHEMYITQN